MANPGSIEDGDEIMLGVPHDEASLFHLVFPECDSHLTPVVGRTFRTLEDGEIFYKAYASACGFQIRKSTIVTAKDATVLTRYLVCNREGLNEKTVDQSMKKNSAQKKRRKTTSSRVDCMARIVFQFEAGVGYRVSTFNDGHTHTMVPEAFRHLMKSNREVNIVHKMFVHAGIKANIGPVRAFRFYNELVGGNEEVGATLVDFKNYGRDLRAFVDGVDAQIILDNFKFKKENCSGFKYYFDVDEAGNLNRLFWADDKAIENYQIFGDAVSFDATYSTNRYKMIFTPFTGRDNHGGCVTFGAAIISHEDVDAYTWVLDNFANCMGTHPKLLITDQDPALKNAVQKVFPSTHHRFCLWHITKKVPEKISAALRQDPKFKTDFDGLIWSELYEPAGFETKWHELMVKYGLCGDKWFSDMFEIRSSWIPAYFRDISMSGLFRTTSLSESENSFFKRYLNKNADLVRFDMHFNTAMDAERSSYRSLTLADETGVPSMATELHMERHAASVYTNKKFYEVQQEIIAAVMSCVMSSMYMEDGHKIYDVDDGTGSIFKVTHHLDVDDMVCTCKLFTRRGIPCSHLIKSMHNRKLQQIPDKYILKRWSKLSKLSLFLNEHPGKSASSKVISNQNFLTELCRSVASVNGNAQLQEQLLSDLQHLSEKFSKLGTSPDDASSKRSMIEEFYGCKIPEQIDVGSPVYSVTKGSGGGGRKKSIREKAIEANNKNLRNCRVCNRLVPHDSRNCPDKK